MRSTSCGAKKLVAVCKHIGRTLRKAINSAKRHAGTDEQSNAHLIDLDLARFACGPVALRILALVVELDMLSVGHGDERAIKVTAFRLARR